MLKTASHQSTGHWFQQPVAVETLGALGEEASAFFQNLGWRITAVTAEPRSFQFLMQRLSVALQPSNAAYILGTVVGSSLGLDELFFIYRHFIL